MIKDLKQLKRKINELFGDISLTCYVCKDCCKSYAWTLKEEFRDLLKENVELIRINDQITCVNSFGKDIKSKKEKLKEIPTCKYYHNYKCEINSKKPLFCVLYPIMVGFEKGEIVFSFDTDCMYIKENKDLNGLSEKAKKIIKETDLSLMKSITDQLKRVYNLTEPCKEYHFKEFYRITKNKEDILQAQAV